MDKIDLNAIIHKYDGIDGNVRMCMIEAIHQALVLAAKNTILSRDNFVDCNCEVNKQSILDVEKLIT